MRAYDANYRLTDLSSPAFSLHLAGDAMGDVTAVGEAPGANPATETYGYGALYRLTGIKEADGRMLESVTYNQTGDRLSKSGSGLATGTYGYKPGTHQLIATGNAARVVDADGNTTAISEAGIVYGFGYDDRDRLGVVQLGGTTEAVYAYNALGERIAKELGGGSLHGGPGGHGHAHGPHGGGHGAGRGIERFDYDEGSRLLAEYGRSNRDYVWMDGIPVANVDTRGISSVSYVVADQLGTPRAIADGGGAILWRWAYQGNAWGEQAPTGNGYAYNLRFPGQYFDRETGLNYNVHRDYDSAAGRYIEFDPLGLTAGPNGYAYVGSDPLTYDDPSGLRADTDLCAGLTAQGCMQMGQLGPDYVTLNVTVPSVFEFGGTITRSGTVFQHGGFTFGSLKSIASGKNWGFNLSMGFLLNPCHSGADVNNLVDGPSKSGALYDVVGGGIVHNGSGTAIEMGVGLGGRSMGTSYAGQVGQIEPGLNYVPMPSR